MTLVKNLQDLAALISQAETPETGSQFNARLKAAIGQDEHLPKQASTGLKAKRAALFQRKTSTGMQQPYLNCKLFVQEKTRPDFTKFPIEVSDARPGDVLGWGIRHYGILQPGGMLWEVEEWGAQPRQVPLADVVAEYDQPTEAYRPPVGPKTAAIPELAGTKVVWDGKPLKVFHGTASEFAKFKQEFVGQNFGDAAGFFFTNNVAHDVVNYGVRKEVFNDPTSAGAYANNAKGNAGPSIIPAYINLQNPLIIDGDHDSDILSAIETHTRPAGTFIRDEVMAKGYDGLIVIDRSITFKNGQPEILVVATHPDQIIPAIGKVANGYSEIWPSAWIDPKGEVHECETHEEFAGTMVGPEDRHYPQGGLLRKGWIRIGEYEDDCYAECYSWTTKALAMTQAAFQQHPKFRGEKITVDNGSPGSAVEIPYEDFMAMNKPTEFRRYKFAAAGEHGPDAGENGAVTDDTGQFWGSAGAGLLFRAKDTGRVLFALRSEEVNEPGTWGVWGGAIDYKEDPLSAARRESREEAGYTGEIEFKKLYVYRKDGFTYTTFLGDVPHEFEPRLNWESSASRWCDPGEWPAPLHFGVKALLPQLDAAVEPQGVEHLESAQKKTASDDQQTMAGYYDVVAQVVRSGADTFEKFMSGLRKALGPNFPQFLEDASGNVGLRHLWTMVTQHDDDDLEGSLEHMRISPRKPTGVRSTEDPHGDERLQPGLDAMSRDEQALAHNVAIMETYPGFSHLKGGPRERAEQIIEILKGNLIWLYNEWDQTLRDRSKLWYVGGNRVINRWAKRFNMQPHQIAAVLAALSPQQDWFTNVTLGERLLSAIKEHGDFKWDDAMTKVTTLQDSKGEPGWGSKVMKALGMSPEEAGKLMVGKSLNELKGTDNESLYKQAVWIRAWDQAHNPNGHRTLSPEGEFGDWDRKNDGTPIKNRWNSFGEITKAIKLAEAPDARLISDVVGENHKVRSFYNNLIAPMSKGGDVTIDTHAVAAALLRPLSAAHREVNHNFGMGVPGEPGPTNSKITGSTGLYGFYAEAYRRAAAAVGIQAREMQSITWEAVRGLFKPHQKRSDSITKGTDQAWHDVSGGKHGPDEARQRILELVGGLDRPSWSRPHPGDPAGERDSSYTGELPSGGAPGRGRALPGGAGAGTARGVAAGLVASSRVTATNLQARLDRLASLLFVPRMS